MKSCCCRSDNSAHSRIVCDGWLSHGQTVLQPCRTCALVHIRRLVRPLFPLPVHDRGKGLFVPVAALPDTAVRPEPQYADERKRQLIGSFLPPLPSSYRPAELYRPRVLC